jgi:hypothetical protein
MGDERFRKTEVKAKIASVLGTQVAEVSITLDLCVDERLHKFVLIESIVEHGYLKQYLLCVKARGMIETYEVFFSYSPYMGATHMWPSVIVRLDRSEGGRVPCRICKAVDHDSGVVWEHDCTIGTTAFAPSLLRGDYTKGPE